jgi:hypothetical protein
MHVVIDDGGIDWPAWGQAVGSVVAILVSAVFAIAGPLYMRRIEKREEAAGAARRVESVGLRLSALLTTLRDHEVAAAGPALASVVRVQTSKMSAMLTGYRSIALALKPLPPWRLLRVARP